MYDIKLASGSVIAADTQASVAALDNAVATQARLCASILEVSHSSNLPIVTAQRALQTMASGLTQLVASRADLVDTVGELIKFQSKTTLRETGFGCRGALDSDQRLTGQFEREVDIAR